MSEDPNYTGLASQADMFMYYIENDQPDENEIKDERLDNLCIAAYMNAQALRDHCRFRLNFQRE